MGSILLPPIYFSRHPTIKTPWHEHMHVQDGFPNTSTDTLHMFFDVHESKIVIYLVHITD